MDMIKFKTGLDALRSEHSDIRAVLDAMEHFARHGLDGDAVPQPTVFRAMLMYIDLFAERVHHPKEERALFPLLRHRNPAAKAILDRLESDHARGAGAVHELEHDFLRWEEAGSSYFREFARAILDFVSFYRSHLRTEEEKLIPLAEQSLTEEDWRRVDASFEEGADPLRAPGDEHDLRKLLTHIVTITPAPIGVADPLPER